MFKTGTTEESIAQATKIGFKTDLVAINPLDKKLKYLFILLILF
jgi:leucyl-tRNA synthetase